MTMANSSQEMLKKFMSNKKKLMYAFVQWHKLKMKNFTATEAFNAIYNECEGNENLIEFVLKQLTAQLKVKPHGRSQVYAPERRDKADLVYDENGELKLKGIDLNWKEKEKGMKNPNEKIFTKDGQTNKNYQKFEDHLYDIGKDVRELNPHADKELIALMIKAVQEYANKKKISYKKVIERLKKGRLRYISGRIYPIASNVKESKSKTIIIKEGVADEIQDEIKMTDYKFKENVKYFLKQLLDDPINADTTFLLKSKGYTRSKFIPLLLKYGILEKEEKIVDKDGDGNTVSAKMSVKYKVPKKNFDRKLDKLYISLFERNVPEKQFVNEEGEAACGATSCDSSGQFIKPAFSNVVRRTMPTDITETATTDVGDYGYDVPLFGDKETLARKNGVNGSVSVNFK